MTNLLNTRCWKYSVSDHIFDFQCQCIQWLLFVRSVNRHCHPKPKHTMCMCVCYLSIQLNAFVSWFPSSSFIFCFNDNDMKSYNKYRYLLATFFLSLFCRIGDCFVFDIYIELPELRFQFRAALPLLSISWPLIQFAFLRRQFSIY